MFLSRSNFIVYNEKIYNNKFEECSNNKMITYNTYILRQDWRYFSLIFKEAK